MIILFICSLREDNSSSVNCGISMESTKIWSEITNHMNIGVRALKVFQDSATNPMKPIQLWIFNSCLVHLIFSGTFLSSSTKLNKKKTMIHLYAHIGVYYEYNRLSLKISTSVWIPAYSLWKHYNPIARCKNPLYTGVNIYQITD